ncbi:hypothetical protein [Vreelandella titanicae]|uniref:hypothetical protein n=1 Tax=Vreelandella titanicae TaxID=664683 RepID=UPI003FD7C4D3|tara:strand:+ start:1373 stop:2446 length:1074 start_codon:yes stop_codon:yes gene_type:complete
MMPFGKDKALKERDNWLKKRESLSDEHSDIASQHRQQKHIAATQDAETYQLRWDALAIMGVNTSYVHANGGLPGLQQICAQLNRNIKEAELASSKRQPYTINIDECKGMLKKLDAHLKQKELALKNAERLEPQLEVAEERLEEHEANKPPASHALLTSYDKEIEALNQEHQRILDAISKQSIDSEATQHAEKEVAAAQEKLDGLEAAAALGEMSDGEQQQATSVLTRARKKLDDLMNTKARREAARRGLERKLKDVGEKRDTFAKERADLAQEVYLDDLADAENQLLDMLNHPDLHALVKKINETRERYNVAFNHGNGDAESTARRKPQAPLTVNIEVDRLIALEEAKALNRAGIRI